MIGDLRAEIERGLNKHAPGIRFSIEGFGRFPECSEACVYVGCDRCRKTGFVRAATRDPLRPARADSTLEFSLDVDGNYIYCRDEEATRQRLLGIVDALRRLIDSPDRDRETARQAGDAIQFIATLPPTKPARPI